MKSPKLIKLKRRKFISIGTWALVSSFCLGSRPDLKLSDQTTGLPISIGYVPGFKETRNLSINIESPPNRRVSGFDSGLENQSLNRVQFYPIVPAEKLNSGESRLTGQSVNIQFHGILSSDDDLQSFGPRLLSVSTVHRFKGQDGMEECRFLAWQLSHDEVLNVSSPISLVAPLSSPDGLELIVQYVPKGGSIAEDVRTERIRLESSGRSKGPKICQGLYIICLNLTNTYNPFQSNHSSLAIAPDSEILEQEEITGYQVTRVTGLQRTPTILFSIDDVRS